MEEQARINLGIDTPLPGGGRKKLVNTIFDYALNNIWDIKTHSSLNSKGKQSNGLIILNDSWKTFFWSWIHNKIKA